MPLSLKQRLGLELQRALRHNGAQMHPLRTLFWECTLRCNMNCRHCGSDCKSIASFPMMGEADARRTAGGVCPDMPVEDFLHVIDSITPHVDPHGVFVIFTGGEALLRDDLEEVGRELYRREYPWGVVTNGYLLDERRLESLLASGMHSITVSLDGMEEQHNWIRRNRQSFERAVRAIGLLADRDDVLWDVVTCVNPQNYPHLREFKEFLVSLGVPAWRLFSIFPMGRAANAPDLQLSDGQFRGLMDFIQGERSKVKDEKCCASETWECRRPRPLDISYACEGFLGEYEQRVRDHFFYCRSGIEVASIRCDGAISGCTSVRSNMDQGNIYKDDFWDVWQNRFGVMRDRGWTRKGQCRECKMWRYCEGSGLHLYDDDGELLCCHYNKLKG